MVSVSSQVPDGEALTVRPFKLQSLADDLKTDNLDPFGALGNVNFGCVPFCFDELAAFVKYFAVASEVTPKV
jgi:hypothetical protein